ncbi:TPA: HNH endonuclease [Mannheimia haemolytica]|uniref:Endonuclease n=2 Tax=Mannheimia haemolytica TaxID=75985 RepID=A0A547HB80_MANHA|nr:HNH endonuclease [Mannheimia haemolytica]YP_009193584.1 HNH endonuclease [Mannheimia phage vB_MhS_587AP2]AJA73008.1 HNH homing endonuclease [Mannheimia phage vB_MhS_587AP2]MDW0366315.1 HNH endonuclease [Mannheimia haemolytica]MDW0369110.1 HNH endonuclease [Mannheimia haemolytica]MDW0371424.1 HNH endonuclease [Mannheimia haemolytica]MDW0376868.1 HNH endonuclease [Mannheimia haemolytica]
MRILPRNENYAATENGEIFSFLSNKILKPRPLKNGYLRVQLVDENGVKDYLIHRLVCETFHGYPDLHVNHKDRDKTNNRPENLEWCTRSENMLHCSRLGGFSKQSERMKKMNIESCSVPVAAITLDGKLFKKYTSMTSAGKDGFSHSKISLCIQGKRKTHKGYIWQKL